MKLTLSWLKEHLDTEASLKAIVAKLTMVGLEVEEVEDRSRAFAPFRIAHVVSAEKHPNADRLKVCVVDLGDGTTVQVVCGAPNARAGMIGVFAPAGTHIPGTGINLEKGVIRGVESHGMLLSERELGLSDDHEGIVELPGTAPVGSGYAAYAGLDEIVLDIGVTTNRGDALGASGIARDLAAGGVGRQIDRPVTPVKGAFPCPVAVTLDFGETASLCPAFALRLVRGVKNGPSPQWLQKRLRAVGLRPINTLVDITNFLTYDRNRPLHVFDAAKVKGNLVVRRARSGEEILALDGKTYTLDLSGYLCHRRRQRCRVDCRRDGRGGIRLHRHDHGRSDRIGLVGADQHRPDRPQSWHSLRRQPPLRAQCRPRFHGPRAGARDEDGARVLRRRA